MLTTNREEFLLPLHLISEGDPQRYQSVVATPGLWLQLASLLETNPTVLRYIVVPEKSSADDTNSGKMVYLTASTADLQKFLLKHAVATPMPSLPIPDAD